MALVRTVLDPLRLLVGFVGAFGGDVDAFGEFVSLWVGHVGTVGGIRSIIGSIRCHFW